MDAPDLPAMLLAYSDEKAAALLDVKRGVVRGLVDTGQLRTIAVGRHKKIPHVELERYIREQLET